ncbi:hypothetical protein [Lentzea nigeriaca]|nr:hypothetical protein [Lentzea nigeriaca]MBM7863584.1 hypothetical protein [Lentzea nigeriaca]
MTRTSPAWVVALGAAQRAESLDATHGMVQEQPAEVVAVVNAFIAS